MFKQFPVHHSFLSVVKVFSVFWVKAAEMVHELPRVEHKGKKIQHLRSLLFMNFYVSISQLLNCTRQLSHTELFSMVEEKRTRIKWSNAQFLLRLFCMHFLCACFLLDVKRTDHTIDQKISTFSLHYFIWHQGNSVNDLKFFWFFFILKSMNWF